MKKILLASAFALCLFMHAQSAGNLKMGAHLGLPSGNTSSLYNFYLGVDVAYMFLVSEKFNLGITTGYSFFRSKDWNSFRYGTLSLVPVAATMEYTFSEIFSFGIDLGYSFCFNCLAKSGSFYYQPKVAYHLGRNEVYVGYMGIKRENNSPINSVTLGYAYSFGE